MSEIDLIIDRAFAGTVYPGDDCLTVYDKEGREYDDTWQLLHAKNWRDMPVYDFIMGDTPVPDLTPQAFHYYLPALLKRSLSEDQSVASDHVFLSLTFCLDSKNAYSDHPEFGYDVRDEYQQFRALLTAEQIEAILGAIEKWRSLEWLDEDEYKSLVNAFAIIAP